MERLARDAKTEFVGIPVRPTVSQGDLNLKILIERSLWYARQLPINIYLALVLPTLSAERVEMFSQMDTL